ncbi:MAG: TrkH family potassium uptake protein [Rhodobacteraceae bacterium]|nr:TrkH family potassium uptake protein [Paracoccaceae bacterium]
MIDFRPVGYVVGLLVAVLGATMLVPMALDLYLGNAIWINMLESAIATVATGLFVCLSCANGAREKLTLQQIFLLTTGVWLLLPVFGALPLYLGLQHLSYVDAYFEAMSGLTTTGATVLSGLDQMPQGILLWRGMLQWFGGVGIVVVAMVFLPEVGVGGMQIFKSEGFETDGKILPRATQIAAQISVIYVVLTAACALTYAALGMNNFDALVHAMTTLSTGGFANYDSSFGRFDGELHYACSLFMISAALPFVRYIQFAAGATGRLFRDKQVQVFLWINVVGTMSITLWLWSRSGVSEISFREALFNSVSILTGTGYASADYTLWGTFPPMAIFFLGLIGGCAGSTACSVKVFRYQLLFASLRVRIRRIHSPNAVMVARYEGKPVSDELLSSVMVFFAAFVLSIGGLSVALGMTGLDQITALSGAATAIANIGPGLGPEIGPAGNFAGLNDMAKWLLSAGMLVGRLELVSVIVIMTPHFWRT